MTPCKLFACHILCHDSSCIQTTVVLIRHNMVYWLHLQHMWSLYLNFHIQTTIKNTNIIQWLQTQNGCTDNLYFYHLHIFIAPTWKTKIISYCQSNQCAYGTYVSNSLWHIIFLWSLSTSQNCVWQFHGYRWFYVWKMCPSIPPSTATTDASNNDIKLTTQRLRLWRQCVDCRVHLHGCSFEQRLVHCRSAQQSHAGNQWDGTLDQDQSCDRQENTALLADRSHTQMNADVWCPSFCQSPQWTALQATHVQTNSCIIYMYP